MQTSRHTIFETAEVGCLVLLHLPIAWIGWFAIIWTLLGESGFSSSKWFSVSFGLGLMLVPKVVVGASYAASRPSQKLRTFALTVVCLVAIDLVLFAGLVFGSLLGLDP
jgi:hypothetical protein